eukprot:TRINITY_DN5738_c0_g1_i2.p1 TRINITY_DN5738_c0_g1~~TRINITY_DN5738_c0_g1_i2.p1  ORF type:complete len:296 (-),score=17.80 TRINITY_DN5738_c0_g1_i2:217-1038(-)
MNSFNVTIQKTQLGGFKHKSSIYKTRQFSRVQQFYCVSKQNIDNQKKNLLSFQGIMNVGIAFGLVSSLLLPGICHADDEASLSPYERRLREKERRMELLRNAREKALEKASSESPEPTQQETPQSTADFFSSLQQSMETAPPTTKSQPVPPPVTSPVVPESSFKGMDFSSMMQSKPEQKEEKKQVQESKTKALLKEDIKQVKKQEQVKTKTSTKRKGPLPLFLAQLLVLFMFVGVGVAFTKFEKTTMSVLSQLGQKIVQVYEIAEEKLGKSLS